MSRFYKELLRGLKWVLFTIIVISFFVGVWVGLSWSIGWLVNRFFDLQNFGPQSYISFGSIILVLCLAMQIVTVVITAWALITWGKARGLYKKNIPNNTSKS
jgi:uncharacterized membrane protein